MGIIDDFKRKKEYDSIKPLFAWDSLEFSKADRGKRWYTVVISAALILAIVLFLIGSRSGALLAVIASLFFIYVNSKPKSVGCVLYQDGIVVDGKVYHFGDFMSFSVDQDKDLPRLRLRVAGRFGGFVILPLGNTDPGQIYQEVSKHLPEVNDRSTNIIDLINKYL